MSEERKIITESGYINNGAQGLAIMLLAKAREKAFYHSRNVETGDFGARGKLHQAITLADLEAIVKELVG